MKKILVVAFVAVATLFTSCKKDENNSIEGTWQLESVVSNGIAGKLDDCQRKSTVTFTSNTARSVVYFTNNNNECEVELEDTDAYTISGDKITTTDSNGEVVVVKFSVSGDRLVITNDDDKITMTYKRI